LALKALTSDLEAAAFFGVFHIDVPPALALTAVRTWPSVYQLLPCPVQDASIRSIYEAPPTVVAMFPSALVTRIGRIRAQ
jgi:hypothetical protein